MLRKVAQGVDIYEGLDEYIANGEREAEKHGRSSALSNPGMIARYPNKPQRRGQLSPNRRHRHSFPLPNEAEKRFQPPFQPVTSATVTTTNVATITTATVGNHYHRPDFQYQGHHYFGARHRNRSYHYHPYQYTPSFDSIALFPTSQTHFQHQNSAFHESMTTTAYQGYNQPFGTDLFDAEVEAVEALLGIRTTSKICHPQRVEL